jgi:hypothetical protein
MGQQSAPFRKRATTQGLMAGSVMLHDRTACASPNATVNEVEESTPVSGVLIIEPVIVVGLRPSFLGFSYKKSRAQMSGYGPRSRRAPPPRTGSRIRCVFGMSAVRSIVDPCMLAIIFTLNIKVPAAAAISGRLRYDR